MFKASHNKFIHSLLLLCVVMQVAAVMPHHHHDSSRIACINYLHLTGDGYQDVSCEGHCDDGHDHDAAETACLSHKIDIAQPQREKTEIAAVETVLPDSERDVSSDYLLIELLMQYQTLLSSNIFNHIPDGEPSVRLHVPVVRSPRAPDFTA